jgi:hypothetical protein
MRVPASTMAMGGHFVVTWDYRCRLGLGIRRDLRKVGSRTTKGKATIQWLWNVYAKRDKEYCAVIDDRSTPLNMPRKTLSEINGAVAWSCSKT